MRVIHARKKVFIDDTAFKNKFVLLVWILSILQWKKLGYETVLYVDQETLDNIKKFGFEKLYDEVNTEFFEKDEHCKKINFRWFWAMPKLMSLYNEAVNLNRQVIVADQDVVPIKKLNWFLDAADVMIWNNKEALINRWIYPNIKTLSLPKDYKLPKWFTGDVKPLNTGVIHFKNNVYAKLYLDEVLKYVKDNNNSKNNTDCICMCNAEQRMIGEFIKHHDLKYVCIEGVKDETFNKWAFHTHYYKATLAGNKKLMFEWHINLLIAIKNLNIKYFEELITNKFFEKEYKYFLKNGYTPFNVKELADYNLY